MIDHHFIRSAEIIMISRDEAKQQQYDPFAIWPTGKITAELAGIRKTAQRYKLSEEERKSLTIVLNTLDYVMRHIDKNEFKDCTIYLEPYSVYIQIYFPVLYQAEWVDMTGIHLEERSHPKGKERKASKIGRAHV